MTQSTVKKDSFNNMHRTVQHRKPQMRDTCLGNKADKLQGFADSHNIRTRPYTSCYLW